jgi:tetratricopeptide (TPR) repeat protein
MAGERRILPATPGREDAHMGGPPAQVDYFISYTAADRAWAEWIAWQLEAAGFTTLLQAWDFRPGTDFVHQMQQAVQQANRTIAVISTAYFGSSFGEAEWRVAFGRDPTGESGVLVPVRVEDCEPPGLLSTRVYIDLVGLDEAEAQQRLLASLREAERPGRPTTAPVFPGLAPTKAAELRPAPEFPGLGPAISNLAPRNPNFTGRTQLLAALAESLAAGTTAVVAAHGLGGIGKSQLALEYCYQHAANYHLIWWVTAESVPVAVAGLAALGPRLGLPPAVEQPEQVAGVLIELGRREGWLLVFDNVERPADLDELLPRGGRGQVLVTSRNPVWGRRATPLRVDVLSQEEAMAFLLRRSRDTDQPAASTLAKELGGLPLALEQAAAYCEQTSLGLAGYLARYRHTHARLLDKGAPEDYPATVATTWRLNLDQIAATSTAAVQLLQIAAFLAPEVIPSNLLNADPQALPADLKHAVEDELALDEAVGALYRYSLITRDHDGISLHRLVQVVARAKLDDQEPEWAKLASWLVWAGFPNNGGEVTAWPTCEQLLPHVLAVAEHAERLQVAREETGDLLYRASIYLRARGQPRQGRPLAERALTLSQQTLGLDHPTVGDRHDELGRVLREAGDYEAARQHLERALAIHMTAFGPDDSRIGTRHNELGGLLWNLGDLVGARTKFERALEINKATLGPNHPFTAALHSNLGSVLADLGDLVGARGQFRRALEITEAALSPNNPNTATVHSNLGTVLRELGDLDGARTEYERALEIGQATLGPNHLQMATWHNNLGRALRELGDLDGARTEYERALQITQATLGPNHPQMATVHSNLGTVFAALGDLDGAQTKQERALEITEATLGPNHPRMAVWHNNLGNLLADRGDLDGARTQLQRAVEISQAGLGPNHPQTATLRRNLDVVLQRLDRK